MNETHQPVLLKEVIEGLNINPDGIYVDATFGRGGHSKEILSRLSPTGRLLVIDKDWEAIEVAKQIRSDQLIICHASIADLEKEVASLGWEGKISGVLLDLGVSSPQLDKAERGFSFMKNGPLDMRMNKEQKLDAATWIKSADEEEIAKVLWEYGEERYSRRIARAIVRERLEQPLMTTAQLAAVISGVVPSRGLKIHPATRSFQGIRIWINKELEELQACLEQALRVLSVNGRLCVISFHSLEDRMVKRFIQHEAGHDPYPSELPITHVQLNRRLKKIASIKASVSEIKSNPRARSARLRIAEKGEQA